MQLLQVVLVLMTISSSCAFLPHVSSRWPWCKGQWTNDLEGGCGKPPFETPCISHMKCYVGEEVEAKDKRKGRSGSKIRPDCPRPSKDTICQENEEFKQCCDNSFLRNMRLSCLEMDEQCMEHCVKRAREIYDDVIGSGGKDTFESVVCGTSGNDGSEGSASSTAFWVPTGPEASGSKPTLSSSNKKAPAANKKLTKAEATKLFGSQWAKRYD